MKKQPSFSMGAVPNKFQIEFIFHKLELILSNPSAKISLILRLGSQKVESSNRFKAMKEINLQDTNLSISTILYENKSGQYQEKIAQIDICLTNSKLTNSIGIIKLDLGHYANQRSGPNFENSEYLQMQRSVEYQGKVLFTVKGTMIEKGVNYIDDVNKRDFSEIGMNKRSQTPTPSISSARGKFVNVTGNIQAQKKITQMMRSSSKTPERKKKVEEIKQKDILIENEQITLEKMLKTLKLEKENKQNELKMKTEELKERDAGLQDLLNKLKAFEKENEELNKENENILEELIKNKEFLLQQQKTIEDKGDIQIKEKTATLVNSNTKESNNKTELELDEKMADLEKNNEKLLMEKLELQIVLQMMKKKKDENLRVLQNLKQTLQQKEQEIDVLNKMYTDLNTEYSKISNKEDNRSPLVPTNDQEECERKCKVLLEKNISKQKDLQEIQEKIKNNKSKWEEKDKELGDWQKNEYDILIVNDKLKEKTISLSAVRVNLEVNIKEIQQVLGEIEAVYQDAEQKFFKTKSDLADIHNVLLEKGRIDMIEEIEVMRNNKSHI